MNVKFWGSNVFVYFYFVCDIVRRVYTNLFGGYCILFCFVVLCFSLLLEFSILFDCYSIITLKVKALNL